MTYPPISPHRGSQWWGELGEAQWAGLRIPYSPPEEFKHRNQMGPGHGRNQMASANSRLVDHGGWGHPGLGMSPSPR